MIKWNGWEFMTSEHVYHWEKFHGHPGLQDKIRNARSAHDALKIAHENKSLVHPDWNKNKLEVMRAILHAKVSQHLYVKKKLIDSGTRELIEDSWRDDFWGWGPNKDGQNQLGKLWMRVRYEILYPSFTTFSFLSKSKSDLEFWINDHTHSGIGLRISDKRADITSGTNILVVAKEIESNKYKVWTICAGGEILYKDCDRDDKSSASKIDVPISKIIKDCSHLQYNFFSLFD
jgi:ribA/ribD-fused uncharacterized protein